jgi:hypothetical protein
MSTKKFVVAAAAALLVAGIPACGTTPTTSSHVVTSTAATSSAVASSSSGLAISVHQNSSSLPLPTYNLTITGSAYGWGFVPSDATRHFTKVNDLLYTLDDVAAAAADDIKFALDDAWNTSYGYTDVDWDYSDAQVPTTDLDSSGVQLKISDMFENDGGNLKVVTAGSYDFEFHPLFIAETGLANKFVIKLAA